MIYTYISCIPSRSLYGSREGICYFTEEAAQRRQAGPLLRVRAAQPAWILLILLTFSCFPLTADRWSPSALLRLRPRAFPLLSHTFRSRGPLGGLHTEPEGWN